MEHIHLEFRPSRFCLSLKDIKELCETGISEEVQDKLREFQEAINARLETTNKLDDQLQKLVEILKPRITLADEIDLLNSEIQPAITEQTPAGLQILQLFEQLKTEDTKALSEDAIYKLTLDVATDKRPKITYLLRNLIHSDIDTDNLELSEIIQTMLKEYQTIQTSRMEENQRSTGLIDHHGGILAEIKTQPKASNLPPVAMTVDQLLNLDTVKFLEAYRNMPKPYTYHFIPPEVLYAVYGTTGITRPKKTEKQGVWARCKEALVRIYYRFTVNCPKER